MTMLAKISHHHQHICHQHRHDPQQTKHLLPEHPTLPILHALEEEILEGIERRLSRETIINVLVILVRFEPEFVGIGEEQQAEEQENDDKSERGLGHFITTKEPKGHKVFPL